MELLDDDAVFGFVKAYFMNAMLFQQEGLSFFKMLELSSST